MSARHLVFTALLLAAPVAASGQANGEMTQEQKIASAESAAPAAVSASATIVDLDGSTLREGANGWVCMPDDPNVPNDSPMCLDASWLEVIDAWTNERDPEITGMGISYMLRGDMPVSNVDPFASGPAAGNEWIPDGGPHIMVVVPDQAQLEGISTDPANGGPWVMWTGTPYAHVMIPLEPQSR